MVATRSKSSSSNNKGRRGGKKDIETVVSKAAVTGEKKLFASCVRSEGTLAMFEKFYTSGIKAEKAENGALKLIGPTRNTEKTMLTEAVGSFNHELHERRKDLKACDVKIDILKEKMIEAIKNGDDVTELNKELMFQLTIAAEHRKQIEKIEQNETKRAVKYCKQRTSWILQRYIEEGDHKCANLGLVDAKQRLEALAPRLQVDQSPDVFDSSKYSVTKEGTVITAKKNGSLALRFTPAVKSGVLKFKVKILRRNYGIGIGCAPTTAENLKTKSLWKIGYAYWYTGRKRALGGVAEGYGAEYDTGDVIEVTIDMNVRTLSFAINGESQGVAFENLPEEGVYPAIYIFGKNESVEIL